MLQRFFFLLSRSRFACTAILLCCYVPHASAQMGSVGTVTVLVLDPSGATVQGANLVLQDLATNEMRSAETQGVGTATFASVPLGTYRLTVTKTGFQTEVLSSVLVQGGRVTDIKVQLKVGAASETLVVSASELPLVELTSSAIATTIDMKQIEDLPLGGRDISSLARLSPGFSGSAGTQGTWNGLPVIAQGNTIDGVVSSTSRMKFGGNVTPTLQARLEDIEEMTVQTSDVDLSQGMGMSAMQVNFVTRRGSNAYHGRIFEDFRNTVLNANSWHNNAIGLPRDPLILNEFGGSAGGRIIKDKLFFFGSFSMAKQPGGYVAGLGGAHPLAQVLSPAAQRGIFTYTQPGPNGEAPGTTVNLFTQVAGPNGQPVCGGNPDPCAAFLAQQALINKNITTPGVKLSPVPGDPNLENVNWFLDSPITHYFPAFRVDYNVSQKFRIDVSYEETKVKQPNNSAPILPGPDFANQAASFRSNDYISSVGLNWTITPTLINQFRGGYYYHADWYASGAKPLWTSQPEIDWSSGVTGDNLVSGEAFNLPVSTYYPVVNISDSASWQHQSHTVKFGFDFYREQDHYYNAPDGIPAVSLGLASGDPAFNAFENYFKGAGDAGEAESLYGSMIGRIDGIGPIGSGFPYNQKTNQYATGQHGPTYNLDELQKGWGLYGQDSFRITPHFTFNYGLRWDFTGDDHDLTTAYHGAGPVSIYGPSGVGNVFKPGTLTGDLNPSYVGSGHQYKPWNVTPQPTIGLAWNPNYTEGLLGRLFSGGNTVIRAGFDIKRFTEPYQYFWNSATNHGMAYFQNFSLQPAVGGGTGTFTPGSLNLPSVPNDSALDTYLASSGASYLLSPPAYAANLPESEFTWNRYWAASGFDPHIQQPYVQEWNLGIQRQIGSSNVLEVRYVGHRSLHQWIVTNPNEVNVFENGFLKEFQAAQANLAINLSHGMRSFADKGFTGQQPLPIFDAAFACPPAASGCTPGADYTNGAFITDLNRGAVGALARDLSYPFGTVPYICNLVGSSLTPCTTQFGYTNPGPYPVNFFQANPYADGFSKGDVTANTGYMQALGYGTYHALQVDFRQKQWHGMQFDVNYTWSHTLGLQPDTQWTGFVNIFSIRDLRQSYGPTTYDLRHVVHGSGTFDLPFGHGKALLNRTGAVDRVVGGWTLGTILTYESGLPFQLTGGYRTFNDYGDGGLTFNGVTVSQLQNAIGVFNAPGPFKYTINPAVLGKGSGTCNTHLANVCQDVVAGTFGYNPWLHGPHLSNDDISLSKVVPFGERWKFSLQAEFLNVFNHPNWANPGRTISSSSFGTSGLSNFNLPRQIELRANITF